jgi:predicted nucleic acid-binding protein
MVFVDTGAWFALFVPSDPNHTRAVEWLQSNTEPLVTTDNCTNETLTLLCVRHEHRHSLEVGRLLFEEGSVQVHFLVPQQINRAWILFQRMHQAGWSFTDCTSKVVIDELGIRTAFAFDSHFQQFGNVVVVP